MKHFYLIVAFIISAQANLQSIKPGIYKEFIGNVAIIDNNVEIWVKFDLQDLQHEIDSLQDFINNIRNICKRSATEIPKVNDEKCLNFFNIAEKLMKQLRSKFENILLEKSKKGLINVFGNGLKFLFGTMDSEDKEKISNKLSILDGEKINMKLAQSEFINEINKINLNSHSTSEILENQKSFLNEIKINMAKIKTTLESDRFETELNSDITDLKNSFVLMYQGVNDKINDAHQMIVDLHNHVLNTKLIGYKTILDVLKTMKHDENLKFPFALEKPNYEILRKLTKYLVLDKENLLIIIFTVPLIENNLLNMNKIYPVPVFQNNIANFIEIESNFLISDQSIEKVISLNNEELSTSCTAVNEIYYCKNLNVFKKNRNSCEIKILSNQFENIKSICNEKFLKMSGPIFIKTSSENKFLVFCPENKIGKLIRKNVVENLNFFGT